MPPDAQDPPRLLALWDIDHTLIETRGVGFRIYQRAFKASTGKDLDQLANVAGRTELDITAETLRINGIEPTNEAVQSLADALVRGYTDARTELAEIGRALPGAREVLARLADESTVFQSVLTGNLREVARIKLEVFGLDSLVDLDAGAYGEDGHDRADLVLHAQRRARERTGAIFGSESTVLIGDTPNDIRAGRDAEVKVIGVASGKSTEAELRNAGSQFVLPDLVDTARVVGLVIDSMRRRQQRRH